VKVWKSKIHGLGDVIIAVPVGIMLQCLSYQHCGMKVGQKTDLKFLRKGQNQKLRQAD